MQKGTDMTEHINFVKTAADQLQAVEDGEKRENLALASVCLSVTTPLQIYVRSAKKKKKKIDQEAKEAWNNLQKQFEAKSLSKKIFYRRKLYSACMQKGTDMTEHINFVKTAADQLQAVEDGEKRENLALASVCLSVTTPLQIYVRSAKSAKEAWDNLQKQFEAKSLSKKIFYRRKLYSACMQREQI